MSLEAAKAEALLDAVRRYMPLPPVVDARLRLGESYRFDYAGTEDQDNVWALYLGSMRLPVAWVYTGWRALHVRRVKLHKHPWSEPLFRRLYSDPEERAAMAELFEVMS